MAGAGRAKRQRVSDTQPFLPGFAPAAPDTIRGRVERVIRSANSETWGVLVVTLADGITHRVSGDVLHVAVGSEVEALGRWEETDYGRTLRAEWVAESLPQQAAGVLRYLQSGVVAGIGDKTAERIVAAFGGSALQVIDEDPYRLAVVPGITAATVRKIAEVWPGPSQERDTTVRLYGLGVKGALARKIIGQYGGDVTRVIRQSPYRLIREVPGVGFLTADALARAAGTPFSSPSRIEAGLLHVLEKARDDGHVALPPDKLLDEAEALLKVDRSLIDDGLRLLTEGDGSTYDRGLIYDRRMLDAEIRVAERIRALADHRPGHDPALIDAAIDRASTALGVRLHENQRVAVATAANAGFCVITGGPGCGKTTIMRVLLAVLDDIEGGGTILLGAPTGKAARRLAESTGRDAVTIHRMLEFEPRGFRRNESNPLVALTIGIDEFSMVDLPLALAFVRAVPVGVRLVVVGDADQLPSVGPGQVLADLIACGTVPVVRLTHVFRQGDRSQIVTIAHAINTGTVPKMEHRPGGEAWFVPVETAEEAAQAVVDTVDLHLRGFGFDPVNDVQVMAPGHKGVCGNTALNKALRTALNPHASDEQFAVGDKVMVIQNDRRLGVSNGEVGIVADVRGERRGRVVQVFMQDNRAVLFGAADLRLLQHAYSCSIHRYQGSECPAVVLVLTTAHAMLLTKRIIYTGITRARRAVVIVGQHKALWMALNREAEEMRFGRLRERLSDDDLAYLADRR